MKSSYTHLNECVSAISLTDVEILIETGEIIETYVNDEPYPSCLIFSKVKDRPLHAVVSYNKSKKKSYIITVYEPDKGEFEDDFQTRRKTCLNSVPPAVEKK